MKTLALSNGDLIAGSGGHRTISGVTKVRQDLSLALGEYYGTDRFHPTEWGSTIINFVGEPIDEFLKIAVKAEVSRVISQYISIQSSEIYNDYINGTRSSFATSDVIRSVDAIDVNVQFDSVLVSISFTSAAGERATLNRTLVTA